jgi:hypothetical protein
LSIGAGRKIALTGETSSSFWKTLRERNLIVATRSQ